MPADTTREQLEQLVDRFGLGMILDELAIICDEKAEHVQSNWQDGHLAKVWWHNSKVIGKAIAKLKPTH